MTRHPPAPVRPLGPGARAVAAAFLVSGVVHLVRPRVFEPAVPRALPRPRALVLLSGAAELACAAGLVVPATRRAAGPASAALLAAVFPANVQMAVDGVRDLAHHQSPGAATRAAVTLARLPLQWPLIRWAWAAGR
ncbi:DoxX family protein [Cellulomonas pakistanensis]|uniref:Membrane protein n=1 Tax=Cellulomonas pakistanensis TaxID=992287 RepID=A0A919PB69_9CELL|nr:DoxX family protein [Cellulomonas pakistanensis]GIG36438.1 membrane protein [Cellulomonas pakistanensis]